LFDRAIIWRLADRELTFSNMVMTSGCAMTTATEASLNELKAGAFDALMARHELGIAVLDDQLRYQSINPLLARFNGPSVEEHIGRSVWEVLPKLAPLVVPELERVISTGKGIHDLRITGETPSLEGRDGYWEASYLPIFNDSRRVVGILAIAVNRTLEHELERTKEESHQLVRRILDNLFTFVAILSPDGILLDANRSPLEAAGVQLNDVIGKRYWDCIWWNYSPETQKQLRDAIVVAGAGKVVRYDVPIRTVGDTRITIDFMLSPLFDDDGNVTHLVASANDISDRKTRETELMYSEERFRRVFDSTADGLIMIDEAGRIMLANKSVARMFGYSPAEVFDLTVEDLVPVHIRERHRRDRVRYQVHPEPRAMAAMRELFARRKDGSEFPVEIALTPLQFPEGTRILATVVDISIQKNIQSTLIKALKEKTALLNEVHHRVKNNLQVVSSLLSLQARSLPGDLADYFNESQDRVKAMALMHQQLYEQKTYESIDAVQYSRELMGLIQRSHLGRFKAIQTQVECEETEVILSMDQALPFGLLLNELITNAMKHAFDQKEAGVIRVVLGQSDTETSVIVEDDGCGIPLDMELGKCRSLGFQLIPGLVEQLEGQIELIRDQGSKFIITFKTEGSEL